MVLLLAAYIAYKRHRDTHEGAEKELQSPSHLVQQGSRFLKEAMSCSRDNTMASSRSMSPVANSVASYSVAANSFSPEVREEWINAVFGPKFLSSFGQEPPRQGVGLSGIASYVTCSAVIPKQSKGEKVGVTLSRLPIGLYVRSVERHSEAFAAGVQQGSVLVDINGLGMLAEPTRQALERIWQYEGHFRDLEDNASTRSGSTEKEDAQDNTPLQGPVSLKLIKNGKCYTAVILSKAPFGISWGPCGNFALVQRSYSFAQEAGVRRGSLVAAVNGRSFRNMDHQSAATELRDVFARGEEIRIIMAYTPAASRTGYHERSMGKDSKANSAGRSAGPRKTPVFSDRDGVEVRAYNLEYTIGSMFSCVPTANKPTTGSRPQSGSASELAALVAAGEENAPTGKTNSVKVGLVKRFLACPPLLSQQLLGKWDSFDALAYCIRFHCADYHEDEFVEGEDMFPSRSVTKTKLLRELGSLPDAPDIFEMFILQLVSFLAVAKDESSEGKNLKKEIAAVLITLALEREDLYQCFYFLLKSFRLTFEGKGSGSSLNGGNIMHLWRTTSDELCSQLEEYERDTKAKGEQEMCFQQQSGNHLSLETDTSESVGLGASTSFSTADPSSPPSSLESPIKISKSRDRGFFGLLRRGKDGSKINRMGGKSRKRSPRSQDTTMTQKRGASPLPFGNVNGRITHSAVENHVSAANEPRLPLSTLFQNMSGFQLQLDNICMNIERCLLKSFSQKVADWALQPWSANKETELAKVTDEMRQGFRLVNVQGGDIIGNAENGTASKGVNLPLLNPVDSSELLTSIDPSECYILPSAHFPLLLSFNVKQRREGTASRKDFSDEYRAKDECLYRTTVEVVTLRGCIPVGDASDENSVVTCAYYVQGAVAGSVKSTQRSKHEIRSATSFKWETGSQMHFESRSRTGAPKTLSLHVSSVGTDKDVNGQSLNNDSYASDVGFCWVDLTPMWNRDDSSNCKRNVRSTVICHAQVWPLDGGQEFDQHGQLDIDHIPESQPAKLELKVTTQRIPLDESSPKGSSMKRMLLYKHDDDLRQEMLAIQFIKTCSKLLRASGLEMKLLTFRCITVGAKCGFIEWVPGCVSLSEICNTVGSNLLGKKSPSRHNSSSGDEDPSGLHKEQTQLDSNPLSAFARRPGGWSKYESLVKIRQNSSKSVNSGAPTSSFGSNPIQDFLRSSAYDQNAPYLIKKSVMDNYVKSCAGYCVVTYLLGVGDRHLDNLLLHQSGHFFHCDFSFILGKDPKTYLPMRITEDMVLGMGNRDSDNYSMFLSLAGAAFVALRRHQNVRVLLSLVRLMADTEISDVSVTQKAEDSLISLRSRLRLDLSEDEAISFMEQLIEDSISSKMWIAVDAMHNLGKRF